MLNEYDVVVIGGGPAGMMAAGKAAENGARVALIEKNSKLGKKLLITGGGRCNITNAELEVRKMVSKYGPKGKALFGSFTRFGVYETIRFFEERKLPIKVEAENRAFPKSEKAEDVWKVLVGYLAAGKVKVITKEPCLGFYLQDGRIDGVIIGSGIIRAHRYIIATGGKSRPETGSTGEGFDWLRSVGHSVEESDPALVPVKIKDDWVKALSGLSFPEARLTIFQDGKKQESRVGKVLLTHFGLSGPLVLNMSRSIRELYKYAPVDLFLDIAPTLTEQDLDKKLLENLARALNKKIKNNLGDCVPIRMIPTVLALSGINPETPGNALTKLERMAIARIIKALPMKVEGFLGVEKAIVTSGGVSLKEIDFKTMRSKLHDNLYLVGDILNFDRPSGGYSLQICWTTGYLAGDSATEK